MYTASPLFASPLSQTFEPPSRSPSPQDRFGPVSPGYIGGSETPLAMPIPVPVTPSASRHHALLPPKDQRRQRHPSSIPSPSSSTTLDGPISMDLEPKSPNPGLASYLPTQSAQNPCPLSHRSPNLSMSPSSATHHTQSNPASYRRTSNSLAGSYTLSLLSSRMSAAHPPHSVASAFVLQIGSTSVGRDIPSRLKCPPHVKIGFEARWHDINQDTGGGAPGGAVMTPWVGNVDVEGHFLGEREESEGHSVGERETDKRYGGYNDIGSGLPASRGRRRLDSPSRVARGPSPSDTLRRKATSPPRFPGYEIGSRGLLQLVIKNEFHALKVYLINYDLGVLEVGGKMLVRERGYQVLPSWETLSPAPSLLGGSPAHRRRSSGSNCSATSPGGSPSAGRREILRFAVELQFVCTEARGKTKARRSEARFEDGTKTPTPFERRSLPSSPVIKREPKQTKAYYLSKQIWVIFPPSSGTAASVSSSPSGTSSAVGSRPECRTERFIEVINPSDIRAGMSPAEIKKVRRRSFATESWEGVKAQWRQRMDEEEEEETNDTADSVIRPGSPFTDEQDKLGFAQSARTPSYFSRRRSREVPFERNRTPVQQTGMASLLTAGRDRQSTHRPDQDVKSPVARELALGEDEISALGLVRPQSPINGWPGRRGDDESERMLSESLQKLPFRK